MRKEFLGDAFDWCKGGILHLVSESLPNLEVVPCLTDEKNWTEDDWNLYAKLLQVKRSQIRQDISIQKEGTLNPPQQASGNDLFLDPDTGIRTQKMEENHRNSKQHLSVKGITSLLKENRIVIIYQHKARKSIQDQINETITLLGRSDKKINFCAINSGHSAMLFISHNEQRISEIRKHLCEFFGSTNASGRVYEKEK